MNHVNVLLMARNKMLECYKNGDLTGSIENGQKIVELYATGKFPLTMEQSNDLYNFAYICAQAGDYNRAIDLYTKSYVAVRTLCGENYDFIARLTNLAVCYIHAGSHDLAIETFKKADEILSEQKSYEENDKHERVIRDHRCNLYNLANAYHEAGMHELAIENHVAHMTIYPLSDEMTVDSINCVGYTFEMCEEREKASRYFADALKLKRQLIGECNDEYIGDLVYYGEALANAGKHKAASNVLVRAAGFVKKMYTEADKFYIQLIDRAAEFAATHGDLEKALKLRKRTLKALKCIMGENHMIYAEGLRNIAAVYEQMGENVKALKYTLCALETTRTLMGEDNALYAKDVALACDLYMRMNMLEEAMQLSGTKTPNQKNA